MNLTFNSGNIPSNTWKYFFIILLSLCINKAYSQNGTFSIQRTTPCDSVPKIDLSKFYLEDEKGEKYYSRRGIVKFPKRDMFTIHLPEYPEIEPTQMLIRGTVLHEIKETKIVHHRKGNSSFYESCGELINGYAEDYYPNGNIRIRGNFNKGQVLDSLVTFYPAGMVKKRIVQVMQNSLTQEYDVNGKLIKETGLLKRLGLD